MRAHKKKFHVRAARTYKKSLLPGHPATRPQETVHSPCLNAICFAGASEFSHAFSELAAITPALGRRLASGHF
jgi:hypothetical protein